MKNRSAGPRRRDVQSANVKHNSESELRREKERQIMKESLLMPQTSVGKTTSASMCEKSNVWAEHRLDEKMNTLDEKLHKAIVKLNSDKLAVVNELAHIRKSASTGNLESHSNRASGTDHLVSGRNFLSSGHRTNSGQNSPTIKAKHSGIKQGKQKPVSAKKDTSKEIVKKTDNSARIAITIGSDSSSNESEDEDKAFHVGNESVVELDHKSCTSMCDHSSRQATMSLTPSLRYTGCLADRSQSLMVENVTRRYAKQLSAKPRSDK